MTTQLDPIEPKTARERELRDRAVRDYAALQAVGLDTTRTFFAPGTEVQSVGKVRQLRAKFENLPAADDGLAALADLVLSEDRQDLKVKLGGFSSAAADMPYMSTCLGGGLLVTKPGTTSQRLAPTDVAWSQIQAKRPAGHPAAEHDVSAWLYEVPQHDVVVRHRKVPENRKALGCDRECFAIVSPGYVAYDLDRAANDLAKAAPAGSRVKTRYDGARATVDVMLQNPFYLDGGDAAGVGETHRVILRMKTADDGTGGYHLSLLAERVRCINLTLLHAKTSLMHGTHRQKNLQDLVGDALEQIAPTMEQFAATWRGAWAEYYADKHTGTIGGEEAIKRIVAKGAYRIPGLGKDGTLAACLAALAEEPGDSRAHVHNALTAAAHKAPVSWATRWSDTAAEEQASQLLYQKVLWLPEAEA